MEAWEIVGLIASIFVPLAFFPQTMKTIIKRDTKNISLICYSVFFIGVVSFLIFGVIVNNLPMIICETITAVFSGTILGITIFNFVKVKKNSKVEQLKEVA